MSDSLVIIPTYNEKENISKMLDTVMSLNPSRGEAFDVLVVDDGSPDGTGDLVREAQAAYPNRIHLLERSGKLGLGTAYIAGFKWGLSKGYAYLFEMDADLNKRVKKWRSKKSFVAVLNSLGDILPKCAPNFSVSERYGRLLLR